MKNLFSSTWKFRMFLLSKLPSAWFSGLRMHSFSEEKCTTKIKFGWVNQNPFRSMYFACQAMAAEMSSGALAFYHVQQQSVPVSMLVTNMNVTFSKKATGIILFQCEDGLRIKQVIENCIQSGQGLEFQSNSIGKNEQGEIVATFAITWSFKAKSTNTK